MLCDHLWATVVPGQEWLTCIGRIAFPIFAFMIAEGCYHTKNFNKYLKRMIIFGIISEIPFNMLGFSSIIFPFHQNVMWTFVFALLCIKSVEKVNKKHKGALALAVSATVVLLFMLAATIAMTDYGAWGMVTVLLFYYCRGTDIKCKIAQLIGIYLINFCFIKGLVYPFDLFGISYEFPRQGFAIFSLIPIWLYNGKEGPKNKAIQYFNYAFYPLHMFILGGLTMIK